MDTWRAMWQIKRLPAGASRRQTEYNRKTSRKGWRRRRVDIENLQGLLQLFTTMWAALCFAVAGLSFHLWRRERQAWYARLAGGFALLGGNRLLGVVATWLLEPVFLIINPLFDAQAAEGILLDQIVSSAFSVVGVMIIALGVAASVRREPATGAKPSGRNGRRGRG